MAGGAGERLRRASSGLDRTLLLALWACELLVLLTGSPAPTLIARPLLLAYGGLALLSVADPGRRLALALGLPAVLLALVERRAELLLEGLDQALVYPAFLGTIALVRALAAVHPAVGRARERVRRLPSEARALGFFLGGHLFGAVLTAGSFALLAPLADPGEREADRARLAAMALRGSCLAVLWSPFFVGMALVSRHLPELPLWQVALLGLALSALALLLTSALELRGGARFLGPALLALAPLLPPVAGAAAAIVLVASITGLASLSAVLLVTPPAALLWLASRPRGTARAVLARTLELTGRLAEEMLLVGVVTVLGRVLAGSASIGAAAGPLLASGILPAWLLLGGLLAAIVLLAVLGLHPLATVAITMALLTAGPPPLTGLALAGLGLLGWALGTMLGSTSLSLLVARSAFELPARALSPGPNGRFVLLFGALAVVVLAVLDAFG
ncbi:MAG: hypothetical protein NZ555_08210 [Geminicoccaceae bacterium]|nr:hypothetical protein [Geminicoccaceae bacterium]MDW8369944.1 hypothetical protein [Geminicoccaceae bacterium]